VLNSLRRVRVLGVEASRVEGEAGGSLGSAKAMVRAMRSGLQRHWDTRLGLRQGWWRRVRLRRHQS
jgi:hypothetical protein